ncbi:MAG: hydrogenase formation protein HypD [Thermodesulfobacteriota bacterium]|nr:hydrogenase formation protein HypD [Thermodesulfobacteriota bacterium]
MRYVEEFRNSAVSQRIAENIHRANKRPIRLMEVCGTHTMSIFRNGIRSLLPPTISLLSGPGCPICVTAQIEIDAFIEIARLDGVIMATFGDLMQVPGSESSLQNERAKGQDIRVVSSPFDAVRMSKEQQNRKVVFAGIGFETTAPATAAAIAAGREENLKNFFIYSSHKKLPPALFALMENNAIQVDGLILPGHVSAVVGAEAYRPFFNTYRIPCVVAGFEPLDVLQAVFLLVDQIEKNEPTLVNAYQRVVNSRGNEKAQAMMDHVFEEYDAEWRGLGMIKDSGLKMRETFSDFDAEKMLTFHVAESEEPKGCACGDILTGVKVPIDCPLYKKVCTPMSPVGPCMVSSEGTCAAFYRYDIK